MPLILKSDELNSKEEYVKWMKDVGFWTNLTYNPPDHDCPSEYPVIVVAILTRDYDGRDRVFQEWVYKDNFKE